MSTLAVSLELDSKTSGAINPKLFNDRPSSWITWSTTGWAVSVVVEKGGEPKIYQDKVVLVIGHQVGEGNVHVDYVALVDSMKGLEEFNHRGFDPHYLEQLSDIPRNLQKIEFQEV